MKRFLTILALITLTVTVSYSQQRPDSLRKAQQRNPENDKQKMQAFYKRSLKVDSAKAEQVSKIMESYKAGMNALQADPSLTYEARRTRIKALMEEKNKKLKAILTPEQQVRIIPGTERDPSRGTKKD